MSSVSSFRELSNTRVVWGKARGLAVSVTSENDLVWTLLSNFGVGSCPPYSTRQKPWADLAVSRKCAPSLIVWLLLCTTHLIFGGNES